MVAPAEAWRRFLAAPVARLATVRPDGRPHLVPVTFAAVDRVIYTAVDAKPKTTRQLRRLANITANPAVSLLVDHYADDWSQLWWVRVDGAARVGNSGPGVDAGLAALAAKYPQYAAAPPGGPVIAVEVTGLRSWSAS